MAQKWKDETGRRYGRLLVLEFSDINFGARFRCLCDCGREVVVRGSSLRYGSSTSCGCIAHEKLGDRARKSPGEAMWNSVIRSFKRSALDRGFRWELTDQEALSLAKANCAYCGAPPAGLMRHPDCADAVQYNGIDRVDNGIGYLPGNVVTSCKHCNVAKRDRSVDDFLAWARRIVDHSLEV